MHNLINIVMNKVDVPSELQLQTQSSKLLEFERQKIRKPQEITFSGECYLCFSIVEVGRLPHGTSSYNKRNNFSSAKDR